MTKAEIVTEIAKTTGIDKASVLAVVEGLMTSIKDSLAHGENVLLSRNQWPQWTQLPRL
ncbi:MAG: HU family DNA-binding protein [Muribaculaceae bacterium]|nr:HU family DNA-binding protein [Muribaculaceae bacterium]